MPIRFLLSISWFESRMQSGGGFNTAATVIDPQQKKPTGKTANAVKTLLRTA
jgi:hypothetical protein